MKNRLQNYIDILLRGDEESSLLAVDTLKEDVEILETIKQKELSTVYNAIVEILNNYDHQNSFITRIFYETELGKYLTIFLQTLNEQN